MKNSIMEKARAAAGARELYAIEHGNRQTVYINGRKLLKFTYDPKAEYQDANGAMFDIALGVWVD